MGIELPPELADVAAQAGVAWPEADEDAMARAAQAWRDAATSMSTLTTDADTTARVALDAVSGETGDAAAKHWKTFVEPDSGHLTAAVRGCTDAADRLEHASHQVGAAKVEIVRQLVGLAQNSDAANAAAAAGHPTALAGLDTAVRGTAANVANIESNLVSAVQPATGVDVGAVQHPVNPNPGTHGPPPGTTTGVTDVVADTAQDAANVVASPVQGMPDVVATPMPDVVGGLTPDVGGGPAPGGVGPVPGVGLPVQPGDIVTPGPDFGPGVPGVEPDPDVTGPVPIPPDLIDAPTPPTGQTVQAGFAPGALDAVPSHANLPPAAPPVAGQAPAPGAAPGFGATPFAPGAPVGGGPAPVAPAPPPPPAASAQPGAPVAAQPRGPVPGAAATAVPGAAAPERPSPPDAPRPKPATMAGPPGAPPARGERDSVLAVFWIHMFPIGHLPVAADRPARQLPPPPAELDYAAGLRFEPGDHPRFDLIDSTTRRAELRTAAEAAEPPAASPTATEPPATQPPAAAPPVAAPPASTPPDTPRGVPLATTPPGTAPAATSSGTASSDTPPGTASSDTPPGTAPAASPGAPPPAPASSIQPSGAEPPVSIPRSGLPADHPTVAALADGHDPLGGIHERDWDRRYLVRFGSVTPQGISADGVEFNWPPSEQYPEGGSAPGEAEVLDEGILLDRFGSPDGRVFAAAGTPFARRSLPPAHLDLGYRRYRTRKPLPVWWAVSAAWFAQPGGGVRYRTTHSAAELVALGYLADVTEETP